VTGKVKKAEPDARVGVVEVVESRDTMLGNLVGDASFEGVEEADAVLRMMGDDMTEGSIFRDGGLWLRTRRKCILLYDRAASNGDYPCF
jgi:hypothetical protein